MASLFPIGVISAASSLGTMDNINYSMFEPNNGCSSMPNNNILVHEYDNKSLFTRKNNLAFISILYEYDTIWTKEYNQLKHFSEYVDDALTSFYVVDWSKGINPTAISGGAWGTGNVISIDSTILYSAVTNYKSNNVLIWDGALWKIGTVTTVTTNTSITVNVTGNNYGSLTYANAVARGYIYPIYTCYLTPNSINGFTKGEYVKESTGLSGVGGFLYSGTITFRGKYRI